MDLAVRLGRQSLHLRSQYGFSCPDCELAHTLITSSSLQAPLTRHEHQLSSTLPNIAGSQTHFTHPTAPGILFGECVTTHPAPFPFQSPLTSHVRPRPPSGSNFSSILTSPFTNSYTPTSVMPGNPADGKTHFINPIVQENLLGEHVAARYTSAAFDSISRVRPPPAGTPDTPSVFAFPSTDLDPYDTSIPSLTISLPRGATSSCPPLCSSIAIHPQNDSSNGHPLLRKRDPHRSDLECELKRKGARTEERRSTDWHSEFYPSRFPAPSNLRLPSYKDSFSPLPATSSTEGIMSFVPESPAATSEDGDVTSEQKSEAEWSIRYDREVKRVLDVGLMHSLDMGPEFEILCVKFSKDGKYLAVGFQCNGMTNIYDVRTGEKTWLVCDAFLSPDNSDQPLVPVH